MENKRGYCFHCGANAVMWEADFTFEDYDLPGEGIVQECHCYNCNADITYYVPINNEDGDQEC